MAIWGNWAAAADLVLRPDFRQTPRPFLSDQSLRMDAPNSDWARSGHRRAWRLGLVCLCALAAVGCQAWQPFRYNPPQIGFPPPLPEGNVIIVTAMDRDLVWETVADVVDDYFRIDREERPKVIGGVFTEGRLDTSPRGSSTIFEPWNHDSSTPYERLESTLQSMRRTAMVRVIPHPSGFEIQIEVIKELENVARPETGAVSLANPGALRNDDSLQRVTNPVAGGSQSLGWIPQGRDTALEQEMLAQIQARLGAVVLPPFPAEGFPPEAIPAGPRDHRPAARELLAARRSVAGQGHSTRGECEGHGWLPLRWPAR